MKTTTHRRQLKLLLVLLLVGIHRRPNQLWAQAFQPTPFRRHPPPHHSMMLQATSRSVVRTAKERTDFLQQALGVDQKTVQEIVKKHPTFLLRFKHETLVEQIKWYQDYLDMNRKQVANVILTYGGLDIGGSIEAKNEKLAAYQSIFCLDASQVKTLIRKSPRLLGYRLKTLGDKVKFFAQVFGFDPETDRPKIGKVFLMNPTLLTFNKETIISKVDWYRKTLGLDKEDKWIKKLLPKFTLLSLTIESLEMKFLWLKDRLDFDKAQITHIVRREPSILARSIEHSLEPSIQWIERRFQSCDKKALGTMICKHPAVLSYSIEANLEPTLDFWTNEVMGGDESRALKALALDPTLLSYSLEKRLLPRWKQYQELGFSGIPSWTVMFKYPNDKWEAYLERKRLKDQIYNVAQVL